MINQQVPKTIACKPITWGPFLLQTELRDNVLDELLTRASNIRNVEMYNAEHMLAADMHDEWNYPSTDIVWFQEQFEPYVNLYLDGLSHHIEQRVSPIWEVDNLWVNYQKQHDFNPLHNHRGDLSFVLYLNVPEELLTEKERYNMIGNGPIPGSIMFTHGEATKFNDSRKFFLPQRGQVFIFPSTLMHTVVPFRTPDIERISVAGNITFTG
jgi:hypothetical protein